MSDINKAQVRGAAQHQPNARDKRKHWRDHHAQVSKDCLRQLLSSPISTFMTILVLAVALALPSFLFSTLANVSRLSDGWDTENKISLYLQANMSDRQVDSFVQTLLLRPDLIAIDLVDASQGLLEFKQHSGLSEVLDALEQNPLPAVVYVLAKDSSEQGLTTLRDELKAFAQVEQAVLDLNWIKRFNGILLVIERAVIALSVLLAFAVLLIIGNTIRQSVESRNDEILVSKLMGATNAWVRRPFLYSGVFYGVVGASMALVILEVSMLVIKNPVLQLSQLYQSDFQLTGLGVLGSVVVVLVGLILGLLGALISVNKFLAKLEPK
ncbi:MAG: cell division protein [Oceanospirillaceae bacterium]|nr:cell division protein [Oceanospirillaceae bacterium]